MNDPIVGIDLGTTNSVVAAVTGESGTAEVLADESGFKIQPSVVSFHPNGSVVVGAEAKQRRIIDPSNTIYSAKRLIGRTYRSQEVTAAAARMPYRIKEGVNEQPVIVTRAGEFAIPEISAIVLDHMRSIAQQALGANVSRAVVTVPANFTDAQRSATATAGAIAGLTIVRVLNEPTAAALAYGHQKKLDKVIAVYDFGGGTFDVTVLQLRDEVYEVLGTAGDSFLGGDDIDELLVDHMVNVFLETQRLDLRTNEMAMQRLRQVAEQTKIELSRRTRAIIKIDEIAYGRGGKALDLELEITRDELITRCAEIVERTFPVCAEALKIAGLSAQRIDDVVLVGGVTKMPFVRERVRGFFGKPPRTDVNPDEAVALGAGLQAAALERILGGPAQRRTAKRSVAPPAPPMELRPPSRPGTQTMGKVTAQRMPSAEPTDVEDAPEPTRERPPRRRTEPQMFMPDRPPGTERPAKPGAHSDVVGRVPDSEGSPVARITKPSSSPPPPRATNKMPPPIPGTTPTAKPGQKTMLGVPKGADAWNERTTNVPTEVRDGGGADTDDSDVDFTEPTTRRPRPGEEPAGFFDDDTDFGEATTRRPRPGEDEPAAYEPLDLGVPPAPADKPTELDMLAPGGLPPPRAAAPGQATQLDLGGQPPPLPGAPAPAMPTIVDVTPHSLGIGTVAGYCEAILGRNSRIPAQTKKVFSTSRDLQQMVRIRVCQGESRRIAENTILGDVVLDGLPPRPRGETQIEVTFHIDASGMLRVRARDSKTGQEQRINLNVLGAQSDEEVAAARDRFREIRS